MRMMVVGVVVMLMTCGWGVDAWCVSLMTLVRALVITPTCGSTEGPTCNEDDGGGGGGDGDGGDDGVLMA
jgi:hypothetical protein